MKNAFMEKSMNFITKYDNYSEKDIEKMRYGLEGIYLTVSKTIIIFLNDF